MSKQAGFYESKTPVSCDGRVPKKPWEIRGSKILSGCNCVRRNGLQTDCYRSDCISRQPDGPSTPCDQSVVKPKDPSPPSPQEPPTQLQNNSQYTQPQEPTPQYTQPQEQSTQPTQYQETAKQIYNAGNPEDVVPVQYTPRRPMYCRNIAENNAPCENPIPTPPPQAPKENAKAYDQQELVDAHSRMNYEQYLRAKQEHDALYNTKPRIIDEGQGFPYLRDGVTNQMQYQPMSPKQMQPYEVPTSPRPQPTNFSQPVYSHLQAPPSQLNYRPPSGVQEQYEQNQQQFRKYQSRQQESQFQLHGQDPQIPQVQKQEPKVYIGESPRSCQEHYAKEMNENQAYVQQMTHQHVPHMHQQQPMENQIYQAQPAQPTHIAQQQQPVQQMPQHHHTHQMQQSTHNMQQPIEHQPTQHMVQQPNEHHPTEYQMKQTKQYQTEQGHFQPHQCQHARYNQQQIVPPTDYIYEYPPQKSSLQHGQGEVYRAGYQPHPGYNYKNSGMQNQVGTSATGTYQPPPSGYQQSPRNYYQNTNQYGQGEI